MFWTGGCAAFAQRLHQGFVLRSRTKAASFLASQTLPGQLYQSVQFQEIYQLDEGVLLAALLGSAFSAAAVGEAISGLISFFFELCAFSCLSRLVW